ncbi:MAG: hypothetical protein KGR26_04830 [Cyanobacteria bacterium REEB65]|nr:hypothetical protein [Cyanobacteria bacterium REEB65]
MATLVTAGSQHRAPLLAAVLAVARSNALRLHTPAHQGRVDPDYATLMGTAVAADLTELDETDDLRDPVGAIAEAQALAAVHWGADRTWFLVGGASIGNQAALLAVAAGMQHPDRRKVVIGRNAHFSAIAALILADLEPVWIEAPWDRHWGVARPPHAEAYAAALEAHPEASAAFATAPSYYGETVDLAALRSVVGDRVLVVDEAHGAHRPRALAAGADLVVHSAHKGLCGPTQGGYLHLLGNRIDPGSVERAIRLLQTTSPNYWILAGLDAARRQAACASDASAAVAKAAARAALAGLAIRQNDDPRRWLARFSDGYRAYDELAYFGVVAEAALPGAVLMLLGPGAEEALDPLVETLLTVLARFSGDPAKVPAPPPLPPAILNPRQAAMAPGQAVDLDRAIGRICGEALCPYPPGIPVLVPGERIEAPALEHLKVMAPGIRSIRVLS